MSHPSLTKGTCSNGKKENDTFYECGTSSLYTYSAMTDDWKQQHGSDWNNNCTDHDFIMYYEKPISSFTQVCRGEPTKTDCKEYPAKGEYCTYTWDKCLTLAEDSSPLYKIGCDAFDVNAESNQD